VQDHAARWVVTRPSGRQAWDALLAAIPSADPLQSWAWAEAGMATGERWDRLVATDVEGRAVAAVQWQLVSPVLGHPLAYAPHGPVWPRDDPAVAGAALGALLAGMRAQAAAVGASAILVDPRTGAAAEGHGDPSASLAELGFEATSRHVQMPSTRVLDLRGGVEASRATWDKDTRNLVRRAAREGVEVTCGPADDDAAVEALHGLLVAVGSRGGFVPRSRAFLAAYGRSAGDGAFICLGRWEGRVIAECVARGAVELDLCGVNERDDPGADPRWEGLSSFKRGFGGEPVRHPPVATIVLRPGVERLRAMGQWARTRLTGGRRPGH
jgi:lipid II:glycine glycyltransferase (peptidoglycan interpeptide bridge formation enzyme)